MHSSTRPTPTQDFSRLDRWTVNSHWFAINAKVVMHYFGATNQYVTVAPIHWPNGIKPVDIPLCGFDGSLCPGMSFSCHKLVTALIFVGFEWADLPFRDILMASLLAMLVLLMGMAIIIYRYIRVSSCGTRLEMDSNWLMAQKGQTWSCSHKHVMACPLGRHHFPG